MEIMLEMKEHYYFFNGLENLFGWTEEQALSTGELERLQQQRQQFSEESVPNFVADRNMLFICSNNE